MTRNGCLDSPENNHENNIVFYRTVRQLKETQEKLTQLEKCPDKDSMDLSTLQNKLAELEKKDEEVKSKMEELEKKAKLTPWNVDTIAHEGFTKTVINKDMPRKDDNLTEEEREKRIVKFVKENEKKIKEYGMFRRYEDSRKFLEENRHLACEDTANYLVIWCINLEMEEVNIDKVHSEKIVFLLR